MSDWIDRAVEQIVQDIKGRRGLGAEWDQIDRETQQEIREQWAQFIHTDHEMG